MDLRGVGVNMIKYIVRNFQRINKIYYKSEVVLYLHKHFRFSSIKS